MPPDVPHSDAPSPRTAAPYDALAPIYDAVYAARGKDFAAEATRVLAAIADLRGAGSTGIRSLLDVACGTGEHLRHWSRHVARCAGLDRHAGMLACAEQKVPGVRFLTGDMTAFSLDERYDAVTCMFGAIAYLPDEDAVRQAIDHMADHLAPGGVLAIEPALLPERWRPSEPQVTRGIAEGVPFERRTTAERRGDALHLQFDLVRGVGDAHSVTREEHVVRLIPRTTFEEAMTRAGLSTRFDADGPAGRGLMLGRRPLGQA